VTYFILNPPKLWYPTKPSTNLILNEKGFLLQNWIIVPPGLG